MTTTAAEAVPRFNLAVVFDEIERRVLGLAEPAVAEVFVTPADLNVSSDFARAVADDPAIWLGIAERMDRAGYCICATRDTSGRFRGGWLVEPSASKREEKVRRVLARHGFMLDSVVNDDPAGVLVYWIRSIERPRETYLAAIVGAELLYPVSFEGGTVIDGSGCRVRGPFE